MADKPTQAGWLPPRAPGAQPAPRFTPAPPEPSEPAPASPEPPAASPPPAPTFVRGRPAERNRAAVAALTLGVVGLALVLLFAGAAFIVSLPCSVAAWRLGRRGAAAARTGGAGSNEGMARAGRILGIAGVVLGLIGMVVWIALWASGVGLDDIEQWRRDLQRQADPDAVAALLGR